MLVAGDAILRDWVQPRYPDEARPKELEGVVKLEFIVEEDGTVTREKVTESSHELFNEFALEAVRQWRFKPALEEGRPIVSAMGVAVVFHPAQVRQKQKPVMPPTQLLMPYGLKSSPPVAAEGFNPAYPDELEDTLLPGEVDLEVEVDQEGRAGFPRVRGATHPAFLESALRTLERTRFTPAQQGPLTKRGRLRLPVGFSSIAVKPSEILAANALELRGPVTLGLLPRPHRLISPVAPRELLLAGGQGTATIEFTIDEEGRTRPPFTVTTDRPELEAPLRAAVESWQFTPAQGENGTVAVRLRATRRFGADRLPEQRLLALLQPGGGGIGGPRGLDRPVEPLWRVAPPYPQGLLDRQPAGEAVVEFVIDREGRVRLPRIISATEEAFGWAAVTAVSQWVFARPTRHGTPVDVTVRIPIRFQPPGR